MDNNGRKLINLVRSNSVFVVCITVRFRVIVFRPFVDEILVGKIRSCSSDGVRGTCIHDPTSFQHVDLVIHYDFLMESPMYTVAGSTSEASSMEVDVLCYSHFLTLFLTTIIFHIVSLGFFDDIIIPHQSLQHPKRLYPSLYSME